MLLSLKCRGPNAQVLSWLLHKRPDRFQIFNLPYAQCYVFFPHNQPELCEACLLLETDPVAINKLFQEKDGQFQYVDVRQYAASTFMCTAITQIYGSALKGKCAARQEEASNPLDLEAEIINFPCKVNISWLKDIFTPLGYEVDWQNQPLSQDFPKWGAAPYGRLTITGKARLQDLLSQLCIFIPILDKQRHFWLTDQNVETFKRLTANWLSEHPYKEFIIHNYFRGAKHLAASVTEAREKAESASKDNKLNIRRYKAIINELCEYKPASVLDLGCGDGSLLAMIAEEKICSTLVGMDVCSKNVQYAQKKMQKYPGSVIYAGSLTYLDKRLTGYDAAILCEVLEHFERDMTDLVMDNILHNINPSLLIITTPNKNYNTLYELEGDDALRHPDHRFELTEQEFKEFCDHHAAAYGYSVTYANIGDVIPIFGSPALMGVFKRCA